MGYGEFNEKKKDSADSKKEGLDQDEDQELFEKVRRLGLMTSAEKRELLKQLKESGDALTSLNNEKKENFKPENKSEGEIDGEQGFGGNKAEKSAVDDTDEGIDKELDEQVGLFFDKRKKKREAMLEDELDEIERMDEDILDKLENERKRNPENFAKQEAEQKNEIPQEEQKIITDSLAEREESLKKVIELGKSAEIDVSDAIADIQEEIDKLRKQLDEHIEKNDSDVESIKAKPENLKTPEKKASADFVKEKIKSSEFCDSVTDLVRVLAKREENGYAPIIDPDAIRYMHRSKGELEECVSKNEVNLEEMNSAILKITKAVDALGVDIPRRSGAIKDDPEALKAVSYRLKSLEQNTERLTTGLRNKEDDNLNEIYSNITKLNSMVGEKISYISRKSRMLENL